jgi:hypothetical protein
MQAKPSPSAVLPTGWAELWTDSHLLLQREKLAKSHPSLCLKHAYCSSSASPDAQQEMLGSAVEEDESGQGQHV